MPSFVSLPEAIAKHVSSGMFLALEGFAHLIPFAAGHEIIRQQVRDLTLLRMTPDVVYDQMVGMGCARKMVFSWCGNPGVGSLYRLRDAIENAFPHALEIDERSHVAMTAAYAAGASRLPMGICGGSVGSDLESVNRDNLTCVVCPFTGKKLLAVRAINPDLTILHAQKADRAGNVAIEGIVGVHREIALAASKLMITVERIVDELDTPPGGCVLPHWIIDTICEVPWGAYPSYSFGDYERDNSFYCRWNDISRSRDKFKLWMNTHVMGTQSHAEFLESVGVHLDSQA